MNLTNIARFAGFAVGALAIATSASAGTQVGTWDGNGNCYPFNCNDSGTSTGQSIDYQQMYASTAFSGPLTFSQISFFALAPFGGAVISGNYDITFGTTTSPMGSGFPITLSNVQTFYDGTLSGGAGSTFSINGAAYSYDPSEGNLVMEVVVTDQANVPNGLGNGYFEADGSSGAVTRDYQVTGFDPDGSAEGLVTVFSVPEPAAWAMMLVGFAGLGVAMRSRRRSLAGAA